MSFCTFTRIYYYFFKVLLFCFKGLFVVISLYGGRELNYATLGNLVMIAVDNCSSCNTKVACVRPEGMNIESIPCTSCPYQSQDGNFGPWKCYKYKILKYYVTIIGKGIAFTIMADSQITI